MQKTWFCQFKEESKPITVGDHLILNCEGEALDVPLKDNLVFLKQDYSLVLLKTLQTEKDFLSLKVTSYKTGSFQSPFFITDGTQSLKVDNLSFEVLSVLTEKDTKAHPAFGPFLTKNPYFLFSVFSAFCFFLILSLFFYRFLKRTFFVKKILKKLGSKSPSKSFVLSLRKEEKSTKKAVMRLEKSFKAFLESQLLIPVKKQNSILKDLKTYHPHLYKKYGANIKQLLQEFLQKDQVNWDHKSMLKLKKLSQDLVFLIEEEFK